MVLDVLLPVLGKISQRFQRHHTYGDVIPVRPDLHSNKHHACMNLIFEDLPLKQVVNGSNKEKDKKKKTESGRERHKTAAQVEERGTPGVNLNPEDR